MKVKSSVLYLAALAAFGGYGFAQFAPPPPPVVVAVQQGEVLTRGPIHEAFAEPVSLQAEAGLVVPVEPPPAIEELPPADRPVGDYTWIPGYWSWDGERNGYIWVSACWRLAPPGRTWIPGYWAAVTEAVEAPRGGLDVNIGGMDVRVGERRAVQTRIVGYQWMAGFWADSREAGEVSYLPAPPAAADIDPPGAAPGADVAWIPGCWVWQDGRYVQRAGYWMRQEADWVWQPAHYHWTPRGYVFVEGYWDYPLDRRGVLFAPVFFEANTYRQRGFVYSPTVVIDVGLLRADLFVYPKYSHYYFGDYYDDAYVKVGIVPRYDVTVRTVYDPILVHDRWEFGRDDRRWEEKQKAEFERRKADKDLRPARTYQEMQTRVARLPEAQRQSVEVAKPVTALAASRTAPVKFQQIKAEERQTIAQRAADTHKIRDERSKAETPAAGGVATMPTSPTKVKLPVPAAERTPASNVRTPPPPKTPEVIQPTRTPATPVTPPATSVAPPVRTPPPRNPETIVPPKTPTTIERPAKVPETVTPPATSVAPPVRTPPPPRNPETIVPPKTPTTIERPARVPETVTPPATSMAPPVRTPPPPRNPETIVPPKGPTTIERPARVPETVTPAVTQPATQREPDKGPPARVTDERTRGPETAPKGDEKGPPK